MIQSVLPCRRKTNCSPVRFRIAVSGSLLLVCLLGLLPVRGRADEPAQPVAAKEFDPQAPIRRLYVPDEMLDAILRPDRFGAVMRRDEFDALVKRAREARSDVTTSSGAAVLQAADYTLEIRGESLKAIVSATCHTPRPLGEIPLAIKGWSVESALLDGQPAWLTRDKDHPDQLRLLIPESGRHILQLQLSTPLLAGIGGAQVAGFDLLNAPVGMLKLTVPAEKELIVNGMAPERPADAPLPAEYRLPVGGRKAIDLRIVPVNGSPGAEPLMFATTASGLNVQPGELTWVARTRLQTFGAAPTSVECVLPSTVDVLSVESPGLASWTLNTTGEQTVLALTWREPVSGSTLLTVRGVMGVSGDQPWNVPTLQVSGSIPQNGSVVIQASESLRLQTLEMTGARPSTGEAVHASAPGSDQTYETWKEDFTLRFSSLMKSREVQAAMSNLLDINRFELDLTTTVSFRTRLAPLFEARVRIPAEYQLSGVSVTGRPADWTTTSDAAGVNEICVPLHPPLNPGEVRTVQLTSWFRPEGWPVQNDPAQVQLPEIRLPQAAMLEAVLGITADSDFDIAPLDLKGLDPATRKEQDQLNSGLSTSGRSLKLALTSQDTVYSGQLEIRRRPTLLTTRTMTYFQLDRESVSTRFESTLQVLGGGLTELRIGTPENAGDQLRFSVQPLNGSPSRVIEQTVSDVDNGQRTWTLKFDVPLAGDYRVTAYLQQPRSASQVEYAVPGLDFPQADAQGGFVAIEGTADANIQITAVRANGEPLGTVDPIDFPSSTLASPERIVAGFRVNQPGWNIRVSSTLFPPSPIPTAIGHDAELTTLCGSAGEIQNQLALNFTATGAQGLMFSLPESGRLWSATLDGRPVEARRTSEGGRIPLGGLDPAEPHQLLLTFATAAPQLKSMGTLEVAAPRVSLMTGRGDLQPLEMLQQSWTLYYPSELELTDSRGWFQPDHSLAENSFWSSSLSRGQLLRRAKILLLAIVVSAGFTLLIKGLRWRGWSNRKLFWTGTLLAGMALLLCLMILPAGRAAREAARSPLSDGTAAMPKQAPVNEHFAKEALPAAVQQVEMPAIAPTENSPPPASPSVGETTAAGGRTAGARLSLDIPLEIPAGSRRQHFVLQGADPGDRPQALLVNYLNRNTIRLLTAAVAILVAGVGWQLRHASRLRKVSFLAAALVVPLAVCEFSPRLLQVIWEGVLLGGLAALGLWGLGCLVECCIRCGCGNWKKPVGCSVLLLLCSGTGTAGAADSRIPPPDSVPQPYVVIPYSSPDLLDLSNRVLVPSPLYRELWRLAHPEEAEWTNVPPAAISGGFYSGRMQFDSSPAILALTMRWIVFSTTSQPQLVRLPVRNVVLEQATLNGTSAPVVEDGSGRWGVVIAARGLHVLEARAAMNLSGSLEQGKFELQLEPLPAARLSLSFSGAPIQRQVTVNGVMLAPLESAATGLLYQLPVDRGGPLAVAWTPVRDAGTATADVHCESSIEARIVDQGIRSTSRFRLQIRNGSLSEQILAIDGPASVLNVSGEQVAGWELIKEHGTQVRVFFRSPVHSQTELTLQLFQPESFDGACRVSSAAPQHVARETGVLGLAFPETLRCVVDRAERLQQIDPRQAGIGNGNPLPVLAYRFHNRPIDLTISVSRRTSDARLNAEHAAEVLPRKTVLASRLSIDLGSVPQRIVSINLPDGYLPIDVACADAVDWSVRPHENRQLLLIELDRPRTGEVEIGLEGNVSRVAAEGDLVLQVPEVTGLSRQTSTLAVWFGEADQAALADAGTWRSLPNLNLPPATLRLRPGMPPQFALRTSDSPSPVRFQVQQVQSAVTAESAVLIVAGDSTVDYGLSLRWTVQQGAVDTLAFTAPDWLKNLEFTGTGIRQARSESAGPGRTRWIISLIEPVRSQFLLTAAATTGIPSDDIIPAPLMEVETRPAAGEYAPLTSQRQFAVVVNLSSNQLAATDPGQLEPITAEELPLRLPESLVRQALALVRLRENKVPGWRLQRLEAVGGAQAVVLSASLRTVLELDGSWRTQVDYALRNRGRQFLGFELPEGARLLSVFVRGEPGRTVTTNLGERTIQLVALPQTSEADLSFEISLLLAGQLPTPLPRGATLLSRQIPLPAPRVVSPQDSPEFGLTVARTSWDVYVPDSLDASPVEAASKSNLKWHPRGGSSDAEQLLARMRSDLEAMIRLSSESSLSESVRNQARSNLKTIELRLQQTDGGSSGAFLGDEVQMFPQQAEQQKLLEETQRAIEEYRLRSPRKDQSPAGTEPQSNRGFVATQNGFVQQLNSAVVQQTEPGFRLNYFSEDIQQAGEKDQSGDFRRRTEQSRSQLKQQLGLQFGVPVPASGPAMNKGPNIHLNRQPGSRLEVPLRQGSFDTAAPPFGTRDFQFGIAGGGMGGAANESPEGVIAGREIHFDDFGYRPPAPRPWTSAGGLSVPMTLPVSGQLFSFSKVGGDPMLTISLRSRQTWSTLIACLWGAGVLAISFLALRRFRRTGDPEPLWNAVGLVLLLAAILGTLALPGGGRWICAAGTILGLTLLLCRISAPPLPQR